jgi:hypothetical protein
MNRRLYALLVGINEYPEGIPTLKGSINDIENVNDYLKNHFNHYDLQIETLINSQAARANIIELIRNHLCKAGPNDVVLFHFSGHGSRVIAPKGFEKYEPDGKHETLICYDSRTDNGLDLVDKELAVLFSEVAAENPHILAVFDCCHSGSGVRDVNDLHPYTTRYTDEPPEPRTLESYLDGYFIKNGTGLPRSRMALMAACDKSERAGEDRQHRGIFTHTLFEVLRKSGNKINYADLFLRTRTAVLNQVREQTPQLECYEGFNAYGMFLDGIAHTNSHRCRVYYQKDSWVINCGSIHGIPNDPVKEVKIVIYDSQKEKSTGEIEVYAHAVHVDMQESKIEVEQGHLLDINKEYQGDIITLPVPPLNVYLKGEEEGIQKIQRALNQEYALIIAFVDPSVPTRYEVSCIQRHYRILDRDSHRLVFEATGYTGKNARDILFQLARIERWERTLKLKNPGTGLNPAEVDFIFCEVKKEDEEREHHSNEITLDFGEEEKQRGAIPYVLKVRNRSYKKLFFTLLYLSPDFGIHSQMPGQYIPYTDKEVILDDGHGLNIPDEFYNEVIDTFLLIVSTEKLEEYLFVQDDIGKEQDLRHIIKRKKIKSDWFTKSITIKIVRQGSQLAEKSTSIVD